MDTLREKIVLQKLWDNGLAPWKTYKVSNKLEKLFGRIKKVLLTGHSGFKGSWLTIWLNI